MKLAVKYPDSELGQRKQIRLGVLDRAKCDCLTKNPLMPFLHTVRIGASLRMKKEERQRRCAGRSEISFPRRGWWAAKVINDACSVGV